MRVRNEATVDLTGVNIYDTSNSGNTFTEYLIVVDGDDGSTSGAGLSHTLNMTKANVTYNDETHTGLSLGGNGTITVKNAE